MRYTETMSNRHLTLIIPELLPYLAHNRSIKTPGLDKILARADAVSNPVPSLEQLLFHLFGLPTAQQLPVAAVTGLIDGLNTAEGYWFRIDPVKLQVDLAGLYLLGNEHLTVTGENAKLKTLLALDNIEFYAPHPRRWYIKLQNEPGIQTYLLSQVLGKDISPYLPCGTNQNYWRKLMTEIQMLMQGSPFEQKQPTNNGVWLWGGGHLPTVCEKPHWLRIYTDNILAQGLVALNKISRYDLPPSPLNIEFGEGKHLVVIDRPDLETLDENWFLPLVKILAKKQLMTLDLYLGDDQVYRITSRTIHYFWRRKKSL